MADHAEKLQDIEVLINKQLNALIILFLCQIKFDNIVRIRMAWYV